MTSADEPQDRHPQVRCEMRWWLECTQCGAESFGSLVPTFASEADLWREMLSSLGHGWTRRDDGRVLCHAHSSVADCERDGHDIAPWVEHPIDGGLEWRYCVRCGACFEQRVSSIR